MIKILCCLALANGSNYGLSLRSEVAVAISLVLYALWVDWTSMGLQPHCHVVDRNGQEQARQRPPVRHHWRPPSLRFPSAAISPPWHAARQAR